MSAFKSAVIATTLAAAGANAYRSDLSTMPNGVGATAPAFMVCEIGHAPPCNTGTRTAFGNLHNPDWKVFCEEDSDNDGQKNGAELGDPCCVWRSGDTPMYTTGLSNPADAGDTNNIQKPAQCPPYPIDCKLEYSPWTTCTAECGGGQQTRTSSVGQEKNETGRDCPAPKALERACNTKPCKVDAPDPDPVDNPNPDPSDDDTTTDAGTRDPDDTGKTVIVTRPEDSTPAEENKTFQATATSEKNSGNKNLFQNGAASNIVPSAVAFFAVVATLLF